MIKRQDIYRLVARGGKSRREHVVKIRISGKSLTAFREVMLKKGHARFVAALGNAKIYTFTVSPAEAEAMFGYRATNPLDSLI